MEIVKLTYTTLEEAIGTLNKYDFDEETFSNLDLHKSMYPSTGQPRKMANDILTCAIKGIDGSGNDMTNLIHCDFSGFSYSDVRSYDRSHKSDIAVEDYLVLRSTPEEINFINPAWRKNNLAIPDTRTAMLGYFGRRNETSPMLASLAMLRATCLGETGVDIDRLRAVVAIPVAATQELNTLPRTLDLLRHQQLQTGEFEVLLYLNESIIGEIDDVDKEPLKSEIAKVKQIEDLLTDYKQKYPEFKLRWFKEIFIGDCSPTIATIRLMLADVICADLLNRNVTDDHEIAIVNMDADTEGLSTNYLNDLTTPILNRQALITTGVVEWGKLPGIDCSLRSNRLLKFDSILIKMTNNHNNGLFHTSEAVTAINAKALFGSGGYKAYIKKGEIINIVQNIRMLCNNRRSDGYLTLEGLTYHTDPVKLLPSAVMRSNPRRLAMAMYKGLSPHLAWSDQMPFLARDPVRLMSLEDLARGAQHNAERYGRIWAMEMSIDYLLKSSTNPIETTRTIRNTLGLL